MQLVRERLALFNQGRRTDATLTVTDLEGGTRVEVRLPSIFPLETAPSLP